MVFAFETKELSEPREFAQRSNPRISICVSDSAQISASALQRYWIHPKG
jgi:hypothetical protein